MHHRARSLLLLTASTLAAPACLAAVAPSAQSLYGFAPDQAATEQALEQRFDGELHPADLRAWLKSLASEANHVGSPHDKANAEFVRDQLRQWGWDAEIETFDVLYPTLRQHTLELMAPTNFVATLKEPPIAGDETSTRTDGLPPYNVYGADGDVTGDLVYLNYGMQEDYKDLARRGIEVKGKIVIARYGNGWRGLKPKLAQQHGAIGCIIYSDPRDDGYSEGDVYPQGGWRPPGGVQRGSVADMPIYAGDPLTPGVGATRNAKRLALSEAKTILKIPTLPISYRDATRIIAALEGPLVTGRQRGALGMAYHWGGSDAVQVHLAVKSDWSLKPVYDVIATLPGATYPNQWIVRGNHHDGWVFGASDPLTGQVALMSEAKALGALYRSGWRPAAERSSAASVSNPGPPERARASSSRCRPQGSAPAITS